MEEIGVICNKYEPNVNFSYRIDNWYGMKRRKFGSVKFGIYA